MAVDRKAQRAQDERDIASGRAFVGTDAEFRANCARIAEETMAKVKANCRLCETAFGRKIAEKRGYVCREECQDNWEYPPVEDVVYSKHGVQ